MDIELEGQIFKDFGENLVKTGFGEENAFIVDLTDQNSVYQSLIILAIHGKFLNNVFRLMVENSDIQTNQQNIPFICRHIRWTGKK